MNKIKVACVGDSITFGSSLEFRERDCYPNVLNNMLQPKYTVQNFGVSGSCAIHDGNQPYINEHTYEESLEYQPDIVLFMLGTNDSKTQNWNPMSFRRDYINLVNKYLALKSQPKVYLMTTIPGFEDLWNMQCSVIEKEILPMIHDISKTLSLDIIDTNTPFINKPELTTDNIHPNAAGAKLLAEIVSKILL